MYIDVVTNFKVKDLRIFLDVESIFVPIPHIKSGPQTNYLKKNIFFAKLRLG